MQYLTVPEYAKLFGKSRQSVYRSIKRKTIPFTVVKVEQGRIPVDDIEIEKVKKKG